MRKRGITNKTILQRIKELKKFDIVEVVWLDSGAIYMDRSEQEDLFHGHVIGYFDKLEGDKIRVVFDYQTKRGGGAKDSSSASVAVLWVNTIEKIRKLK